jgi:hypothetical protein
MRKEEGEKETQKSLSSLTFAVSSWLSTLTAPQPNAYTRI